MLPQMAAQIRERETRTVKMSGLNFTDNYSEGQLASCRNLSARRYPYLATRLSRVKQSYSGIKALSSWNSLFLLHSDGKLYYGDTEVTGGTLTVTEEKQMVMINTKMVIWPDKKYVKMSDLTLHDLAATASVSKPVFSINSDKYPQMVVSTDLSSTFVEGDAIMISGCTVTGNNRSIADDDGGAVISSLTVSSGKTTLEFKTWDTDKFTAGTETGTVTLSRPVPDMDYICESENRIWGCNSEEQTIYACALGDPTTWYDYSGESTDSYAVAVGSKGDFTGCTKLSSSVLFFKEDCIHKMLGGYPAEYTLYTYYVEGLKKGCHKSMKVISETLFYAGSDGVYAYSGGTPTKVSQYLGEYVMDNAHAGATNDAYYISYSQDSAWHLLTYDIDTGAWFEEDDFHAVDFTTIGNDIYALNSDGEVYKLNGSARSSEIEWEAVFKPLFETVSGSYNSSTLLFNKKRYSKLILRLDLPSGSTLDAYVRLDDGEWQSCGSVTGTKETLVPFVIPIGRCDKLEIKLSGKGECTVLNMIREYHAHSYK